MEKIKPHIAIIYTFNDIQSFAGGQRGGIKSFIDYFQQLLISYESISENWKGDKFTYEFHVVHSDKFSDKKQKLLDELGIITHRVKNAFGNVMLRSNGYLIDIDCDFRLLLDNDTLGLEEPEFDFNMDIQAMFGGCKWNRKEWEDICEWLNLPCPDGQPIRTDKGGYNKWNSFEYIKYITTGSSEGLFPYFNNGVMFIRNSLSKHFGALLVSTSWKYFKNPDYKVDAPLTQDVLGIVTNTITDKWSILPIGTNLLCLLNQPKVLEFTENYKGKVSLIHYIMLKKNQRFGDIVMKYFNQINEKYLK